MEHGRMDEEEIGVLRDKAEDLEPEDFEDLADEQGLSLEGRLFPELLKEKPGSEVMLIVKGVLGRDWGPVGPGRQEQKTLRVNIRHAFLVHGRILTAKARKALSTSDFALPGRRYPIHDLAHARNALARVSQFGSMEEKMKVRAAVRRKFPSISGGEK